MGKGPFKLKRWQKRFEELHPELAALSAEINASQKKAGQFPVPALLEVKYRLELVTDTNTNFVRGDLVRYAVETAEIIVLLAKVGVAILNATNDVLGDLGFCTGTGCPADVSLAVAADIVGQLAFSDGNTACTVEQDRIKSDTGTGTDRTFYALLGLVAEVVFLGTGITDVTFSTVYELTVLQVVAAVSATLEAVGIKLAFTGLVLVPAVAAINTEVSARPIGLWCLVCSFRRRSLFSDDVSSENWGRRASAQPPKRGSLS